MTADKVFFDATQDGDRDGLSWEDAKRLLEDDAHGRPVCKIPGLPRSVEVRRADDDAVIQLKGRSNIRRAVASLADLYGLSYMASLHEIVHTGPPDEAIAGDLNRVADDLTRVLTRVPNQATAPHA